MWTPAFLWDLDAMLNGNIGAAGGRGDHRGGVRRYPGGVRALARGAVFGRERKYSFRGYADDGKGIYESNFPKGTPKKAKGERILRFIQDVWSKKPITLRIDDGGKTQYIEAQFDPTYSEDKNLISDASKLMGGNRHGNAAEKRVTLDLADDYYQLAAESKYNYSKDETGKDSEPHKDVKRWHYFVNDIYFAEQGSEELIPYRVSINVKEKGEGHYFYSFSAEKAKGTSTQRTLHAAVNDSDNTTANGSSFETSIYPTEEAVKKFSLADEAEDGSKMPLAEFMGQYAQEKAEPWRRFPRCWRKVRLPALFRTRVARDTILPLLLPLLLLVASPI